MTTTITGDGTAYSSPVIGPAPGEPRTSASVNTGLQDVADQTAALADGHQNYQLGEIGQGITGAADVEIVEAPLCVIGNQNSNDRSEASKTIQLNDTGDGKMRRIFFQALSPGTVVNFVSESLSTIHTHTCDDIERELEFWFLQKSASAWQKVRVDSQSEYAGKHDASDGANHSIAQNSRLLYVETNADDALATGSIDWQLRTGDYIGEIREICVQRLSDGKSLTVTDLDGDSFRYSPSYRAYTSSNDGIRRLLNVRMRWAGNTSRWVPISDSGDSRDAPEVLEVSGAAPANFSSASELIWFNMAVATARIVTMYDGTRVGQTATIMAKSIVTGGSIAVAGTGLAVLDMTTLGTHQHIGLVWMGTSWEVNSRG